MKKMLLATALALLITGCAQQIAYCSKQTGSSSTKGNHHRLFSFLNCRRKSLCTNLGRQKIVVKTETSVIKWIVGFYYLYLYLLKRVCIAHNNCMSCPSIRATLSALLINILLGSFQLFLHSGSASLRVK